MKVYSIRFNDSSPEKVTGDWVDYEDGIFRIYKDEQTVAIFPAAEVLIIKVIGEEPSIGSNLNDPTAPVE